MSTFVLIHGAWHGAWCWDKVVPFLENAGHTAIAIDLPGHGLDKTSLADVSLEAYVSKVYDVIDALDEPAVLAGHSMGGLIITQTAERSPEKVHALVYLAAILPQSGVSLMSRMENETDSLLPENIVPSEDGLSVGMNDEILREAFYADCSEEDVARARELLVPQAMAPLVTPAQTTDERFGSVRRIYIECLNDQAIPVSEQRAMVAELPCERVISMETSHSPFFSAPEALAGHILSVL